jgi:hypothetical protein
MAYEAYVAELTKLGEMYAGLSATPTSRSSKQLARLVRLIDFVVRNSQKTCVQPQVFLSSTTQN